MSKKEHHEVVPDKMKVDKEQKFTITLPNGEEIIIKLNDKEIETIESYFHLLGKHNIRFDLFNILLVFDELNITQISHMVEQSKSTVARHLKSMEEDGMIISRKADKHQKGKIPPKLYQLNKKLLHVLEYSPINPKPPADPKKKVEFYKREINFCRVAIHSFKILLDLLNPLLNSFELYLDDLPNAKKIYDKYFSSDSKLAPFFGYTYFSEKYYEQYQKAQLDFVKKNIEILTAQNNDPEVKEREYVAFSVYLPLKALYTFKKKKIER
ncbi:MAG: winged helix-turn-helix transcriptional regulator [Candidatus Lokiarchaeota archaeon]|nr:winged helix-turn-helix transcriptional regulator [Candidatus Lokiarchaeota archaeon]